MQILTKLNYICFKNYGLPTILFQIALSMTAFRKDILSKRSRISLPKMSIWHTVIFKYLGPCIHKSSKSVWNRSRLAFSRFSSLCLPSNSLVSFFLNVVYSFVVISKIKSNSRFIFFSTRKQPNLQLYSRIDTMQIRISKNDTVLRIMCLHFYQFFF